MQLIYLILICFAAPVAAAIAWLRGLRDASRRERLADRFGRPQLGARSPTIWIHAASMGEVQAGASLVRRLMQRFPQHRFVATTMTATGAVRVKSLFPNAIHAFLPYDLPFAVRGFLDRVQPQLAVILETELWPNLLRECRRRAIPVVIASARISPRMESRYRWLASLFRDALQEVLVAAQTDADADRFKHLGALNATVTGNIKFDIDISDEVRKAGAAIRNEFKTRLIWIAGSTHAGEEEAALAAHRSLLEKNRDAVLVLVPRHPQRFEEVRRLLEASNVSFATRSSGARIDSSTSVLLVDTMGELLNFYAASDIAFVGGSLVPIGGHNLLEPAALGVATICGSYTSSNRESVELLSQAGALVIVRSADELTQRLLELSADPVRRADLGKKARSVVEINRGALDRTVKVLEALQNN